MSQVRLLARSALVPLLAVASGSAAAGQCIDQRVVPPQSGRYFGLSLDVSGPFAVVVGRNTTNLNERAHLYRRGANGWALEQALVPPLSAPVTAYSGESVSIDGPTAAVGYPGLGGVYVYERTASGWQWTALLTPQPSLPLEALFGFSVSVDGDRIAVGVRRAGNGEVHVFERSASQWSHSARLVGNLAPNEREFGYAVDLDGSRLAVGAPGTYSTGPGRVYVFERGPAGWRETERLEQEIDGGRLGTSVSLEGNRLAVGEPDAWPSGAVEVYERSTAGWLRTARLTPSAPSQWFGYRVALDGERILASAHLDRAVSGNNLQSGAAFVFEREGTWREVRKLYAGSADPAAAFGIALALDGALMLASAPGEGVGSPGAVYSYDTTCTAGFAVVCEGAPGGLGYRATLRAVGPLSLRWNNLSFVVDGVFWNQPTALFYGSPGAPVLVVGDGIVCVGRPLYRLPVIVDTTGAARVPLDFTTLPGTGPGAILTGSTWAFQVGYRDPHGQTGVQFSDALEVTFAP